MDLSRTTSIGTRFWLAAALLLVISGGWIALSSARAVTSTDARESPDQQRRNEQALLREAALVGVTNAQAAMATENYGVAREELRQAERALQTLITTNNRELVAAHVPEGRGSDRRR